MPNAKVTTKGQITIPAKVRRKLGVRPGSVVSFVPHGNSFLVSVPEVDPLYSLAGSLRYEGPAVSIEDMDAALERTFKEDFMESVGQ